MASPSPTRPRPTAAEAALHGSPLAPALEVGDEGATLAGDALSMSMVPLGHPQHGRPPSSSPDPLPPLLETETRQQQKRSEPAAASAAAPAAAASPADSGAATAAVAPSPPAPPAESGAATAAAAAAPQAKGGWLANLALALAMIVFSANNSALIWVINETGATTCNILCAAQMVGVVTFGPIFRHDLTWAKVRALRWKDWAAVVVASLARNVWGAYFDVEGMRMTSVPTLAVVEMLEPVEFLLVATCLLPNERRSRWILGNMGLLVLGVLLGLLLQPVLNGGSLPDPKGVAYLAIGGAGYTVAEVIGHLYLEHIPLGIYGLGRVVLGVVMYHLLAFIEGDGSDRFIGIRNLYSAALWAQMSWYGALFVTGGQILWLTALVRCRPQTISLGTSSLFVLNMIFSVLILGVAPTGAEYVGSAVIVLSIISGLLEARQHEKQQQQEQESATAAKTAAEAAGAAAAAAVSEGKPPRDLERGPSTSGGGEDGRGEDDDDGHGAEPSSFPPPAPPAFSSARHSSWIRHEGTITGSRA